MTGFGGWCKRKERITHLLCSPQTNVVIKLSMN